MHGEDNLKDLYIPFIVAAPLIVCSVFYQVSCIKLEGYVEEVQKHIEVRDNIDGNSYDMAFEHKLADLYAHSRTAQLATSINS